MSITIEKLNRAVHGEAISTKGLKETLKHNARMFVCEEHVTLWITSNKRKSGLK